MTYPCLVLTNWSRVMMRVAYGVVFVFTTLSSLAQKPNIIYIMTDDMGYGDLSSYGRKDFKTPNLDKLASQGMKFVNAYAGGPLCTPTRAAFLTGRYPARTPVGLMEPLTGQPSDTTRGLTAEFPSIARLMSAAGYKTALIGKWHLGERPQHSPIKNGFDYFFGFHGGAVDYISHKGDAGEHDLYENEVPVYPKGYLTDLIVQKAAEFLKRKQDKPFFLSINFNAPHWPWQGPGDVPYNSDFRSGGSPEIYEKMMKSLDDGIGVILKTLEDEHLDTKTVVIFTNDNGGERFSNNGGLSQAKATVWEGGIRVPAFVRWPGKIQAGTVTDQVAITMDWTATILAVGGATASNDFPLDGINLMPHLTGQAKVFERTLFWRLTQRRNQKAVRMGDWKYIQDEKGEYLFNVSKDPGEKTNLKESNPDAFNTLKQKVATWEKSVLPPIPL